MNCPECGRFMELYFAIGLDRDPCQCAFWWHCNNDGGCWLAWKGDPIPAPEYDWLYWYESIPEEDLAADPELRAEYNEALQRYLNRPAARRQEVKG
jgi:hypothetical protein